MKFESDVIVVGSGIAGLFFANKLADLRDDLKVTVISKNSWKMSNSIHAQGGIAVVTDSKKDSIKDHIADTIKSGGGLSDPNIVKMVVQNGPNRLKELMNFGVQFNKNEKNQFDLVLEGGHSTKRVVHSNDHTGLDIITALHRYAQRKKNITFHENQQCIELLKADDGSVKGIQSLNKIKNRIDFFKGKVVVLATGGSGQVYKYTTNPICATGDGISLGIKVGAMISNINFIQFHPTALYNERSDQLELITESLRGEGAFILNSKGKRFLLNYDSRGELATRDIVSKAIFEELSSRHEKSVFLDIRHLSLDEIRLKFPTIISILEKNGIDAKTELIPVIPAAHYQCGGIKVNERAQTSVADLYAIGECAETGLHGTNRLASNSLLEALVFAHQASDYIALTIDQIEHDDVSLKQFELSNQKELEFNELQSIIKNAMSKYATIHSLIEDLFVVKMILNDCESFIRLVEQKLTISESYLRAYNCLVVSKAIVDAKIEELEVKKIKLK